MRTVRSDPPSPKISRLVERHSGKIVGLARLLSEIGLPNVSLRMLREFERAAPADGGSQVALAEAVRQAGCGDLKTARSARTALNAIAGREARGLPSTIANGRRVNELLATDDGRELIGSAAEAVLPKFPDSVFLVYVRAVTLAKAGSVKEAHALVNAALAKRRAVNDQLDEAAQRQNARAFSRLGRIWRAVDSIARDDMAWSPVETDAETAEADQPEGLGEIGDQGADASARSSEIADGQGAQARRLVFTEALIQGRQQDRYLAACEQSFASAKSLREQLGAVKAMLRQGLRRMPTYHESYELARSYYARLRPLWSPLLLDEGQDPGVLLGADQGLATVRQLRLVLFLARALDEAEDVEAVERALVRMMRTPGAESVLWMIAALLVANDAEKYASLTAELVFGADREPKRNLEVENFFAWAAHAHEYEAADRLYRTLPDRLRNSQGMMHYVKILQRTGRFREAAALVNAVNARLVSNPRSMCPFTSWSYIRREGELAFCADTADWYGRAPQPKEPKGVVFVMPRDIKQLRAYPLVVLMELKKMGWAVVPLVEGLLPVEPTGNPAIDRFIGCMLPNCRLSAAARATFTPIHGFQADVPGGSLSWGDIDLSHPLWEEAAISRRRFTVDFTCPSLVKTLDRLVRWTKLNATALENAHRAMREQGLRAGVVVLSQCRLPDAVNRFYCEQRGDPEEFFCVHAANGYENYFANFSAPVSTRAVVRNMTAHPELRTASFPSEGEFEAWYQARRGEAQEMLARVLDVTKITRSNVEAADMAPEAEACLERARDWRANGGKVACAFGKIVCDQVVPRDGGPAHRDMKDWLNHTIESVRDSRTLLLIKPHPHELRNEIGTFLTEHFKDLIEGDLPENVIFLGHRWFTIHDVGEVTDLGLVYNGTTAIELGLLGLPALLCSDFAPTDYCVGHAAPRDRAHYRRLVRFEEPTAASSELPQRSAAWLHFMSGDELTVPYRYHARQITNKVVYPPWWFESEIDRYWRDGDQNVRRLAERIVASPVVAARSGAAA